MADPTPQELEEAKALYSHHAPFNIVSTADYAEVFDRHGECVAIAIRPEIFDAFDLILSSLKAAESENQELRASLFEAPPLSAGLRDIGAAPKDRTPILAKFRDDIYPGIRPGRDDLEPWNGRWVVIHHPGVTADGFDIGWSVSAPVGNGGFPDEWIEGWMPLPPAEIGPSGAQRSELAISAPDAPKSNSGADQ